MNESRNRAEMVRSRKQSHFVEETHELSMKGGDAEPECFLQMFNPVTFFKSKFQAGGVKSTIVTLISGTLGAGCLTIPNAFKASGIFWSFIQLFIGAY